MVEGKISTAGNLIIKRKNNWRIQICPFDLDKDRLPRCCGDHCSLFGEPSQYVNGDKVFASLKLCHKEWTFDKFTDERE